MTFAEFIKWLIITLIGVGISLAIMHSFPQFEAHISFSISAVVMFTLFSILIYVLGVYAIKSPNKFLYNTIIVANFLLKMILSIFIIVIYAKFNPDKNNFYLFPFLVIYIFFTIFETFFMMKQANPKYEK